MHQCEAVVLCAAFAMRQQMIRFFAANQVSRTEDVVRLMTLKALLKTEHVTKRA
jgi:hypothetical protein